MQQQQMPKLVTPAPNRLTPSLADREQISHGIPSAIAALFNQALQSSGIKVQCGRKGDRFGVVLEAATLPDRAYFVNWMRQQFYLLRLKGISKIEVYGRQTNHKQPGWRETIDLKKISPEQGGFSLLDWLQQGVEEPESLGSSPFNPTSPASTFQLQSTAPSVPPAVHPSQFLRFHIHSAATALLPLESIREVLKVPSSAILPVPQMPASVLGIYNYRGTILWLVHVSLQLHLGCAQVLHSTRSISSQGSSNSRPSVPSTPTQALSVIVIEADQKTLGLIVDNVLDIETHTLQDSHPATAHLFPPMLLPFVQSYLTRSRSPILNASALVNDRTLQVHYP